MNAFPPRSFPDRPPTVSLVFTAYNEEQNLRELYRQVTQVLADQNVELELVFVDNGSTDTSLAIMEELHAADPRVKFLSLSRNFGHQGGLYAGMCHATGQAVITMDADLQHPPSLLPEMVRLWRDGYDVVYTIKNNYEASPGRRFHVKLFYRFISAISGLNLSFGQSDFRLLDRAVLDTVISIPEQPKFLRGMVEWVGFRQVGLSYDVAPRFAGRSKFSFLSLSSFALDGIVSFSSQPLHWIFLLGLAVATGSFLYCAFALAMGALYLLHWGVVLPPGWSTLAVAVTLIGGVNLMALGIIGEYVRRIFHLCKGRPTYIVRRWSNPEERSPHVR
ncbi:glycosyltransferase family 2 protein [Fundidesulfovibrio butyratiphilus]